MFMTIFIKKVNNMVKLYNSAFTCFACLRPPKLFSSEGCRSFFFVRRSFVGKGVSEGGSTAIAFLAKAVAKEGIARPRRPKLFSFNRRSFFINRRSFSFNSHSFNEGYSEGGSGGSSEGCRSLAIIEPLSYSVIEPFLSFTFPQTCRQAGSCSEMKGCGRLFHIAEIRNIRRGGHFHKILGNDRVQQPGYRHIVHHF
jgi:hypothetical protein